MKPWLRPLLVGDSNLRFLEVSRVYWEFPVNPLKVKLFAGDLRTAQCLLVLQWESNHRVSERSKWILSVESTLV